MLNPGRGNVVSGLVRIFHCGTDNAQIETVSIADAREQTGKQKALAQGRISGLDQGLSLYRLTTNGKGLKLALTHQGKLGPYNCKPLKGFLIFIWIGRGIYLNQKLFKPSHLLAYIGCIDLMDTVCLFDKDRH